MSTAGELDSRELVGGPMTDDENHDDEVFEERPDTNKLTLIQNRAQCLFCFQIVESTHRHEMVTCRCGRVAVDGGLAYVRRVGKLQFINELCVYGPPSISKSEARRLEHQILVKS
jgi:hypothetical protein